MHTVTVIHLSKLEGTCTPVGHTATEQVGPGGLTATEHRLDNGLRLVLSEDHLTPVAAVCLWYDVGSRYEVAGRTGLAHLFEHLMFQGSAQVHGNGHFELVQGAGGSPITNVKTPKLGGLAFKDVPFQIDDRGAGKDIDGFIGQKLLKVADVDYDLRGGIVRLMRPDDCGGQPLAYWLKPGQTFGVADLTSGSVYGTEATATAMINGVKVTVGFSTGEPVSVMTLAAATRAGVSPSDPGVVTAGTVNSDGHPVQIWIMPVKSFEFAGEQVRDTSLRVTSADITGYDLLLGADFFLSHHVYFANGQHKLYVTYDGGPVFSAYTVDSGRH